MTPMTTNVIPATIVMVRPMTCCRCWCAELYGFRHVMSISLVFVWSTGVSHPLAMYESHDGLPVRPVCAVLHVVLVVVLPVAHHVVLSAKMIGGSGIQLWRPMYLPTRRGVTTSRAQQGVGSAGGRART